jgi:hypothetical protein
VPMMQKKEMKDAGRVTSVVCNDVKPKPFSTRLPKFCVPPLGISPNSSLSQPHFVSNARANKVATRQRLVFQNAGHVQSIDDPRSSRLSSLVLTYTLFFPIPFFRTALLSSRNNAPLY